MSKFTIHYRKTKKLVLEDLEQMYVKSSQELKHDYHPFHISKMQCYNPVYNLFFEMNDSNFDSISLNHKYHIHDLEYVLEKDSHTKIPREIFVKFAPLLDPIRYLIGRYKDKKDVLTALPSYNGRCHDKLENFNNASYVDNFFCYLSSQLLNYHDFKHGIDYYGSFVGIQEKFKFNAADDIDYLVESEYFMQQKGKLY